MNTNTLLSMISQQAEPRGSSQWAGFEVYFIFLFAAFVFLEFFFLAKTRLGGALSRSRWIDGLGVLGAALLGGFTGLAMGYVLAFFHGTVQMAIIALAMAIGFVSGAWTLFFALREKEGEKIQERVDGLMLTCALVAICCVGLSSAGVWLTGPLKEGNRVDFLFGINHPEKVHAYWEKARVLGLALFVWYALASIIRAAFAWFRLSGEPVIPEPVLERVSHGGLMSLKMRRLRGMLPGPTVPYRTPQGPRRTRWTRPGMGR